MLPLEHAVQVVADVGSTTWFDDLVSKYGKDFAELVAVLVAVIRGWLVPGYVLRDAWSQRDRALDAADGLRTVAEHGVRAAEKVASPRAGRS